MWAQPPHGEWGSPRPPSVTHASKTSVTGNEGPSDESPRGVQALPSSLSPCPLPGKVPSPSQLSVTQLPGGEVQLAWAAAAASGVLVYQIKWTPLGDGKAHEVCGRKDPCPPPAPGLPPSVASRDLPAQPSQARGRPPLAGGPLPSSPQVSVPGSLRTAVLPGLGAHLEHEITILAYFRDGAHSDPVSFHYSPRR